MGSPSQLFVGRIVDIRTESEVAVSRNDCVYLEFVADVDADGKHKLVSLVSPTVRQPPDPVRCTN
jgi:hypothetical protein